LLLGEAYVDCARPFRGFLDFELNRLAFIQGIKLDVHKVAMVKEYFPAVSGADKTKALFADYLFYATCLHLDTSLKS
jgi:hypothetical protein